MALGKEQIQAMRKFALDSSYPDKKIQLDLIDIIEHQQKENNRLKYALEAACRLLGLYCECPVKHIEEAENVIGCEETCFEPSKQTSDCYAIYLNKKFGLNLSTNLNICPKCGEYTVLNLYGDHSATWMCKSCFKKLFK